MDAPKKYIRTFAGDMETVKKGGIPNLKPLEKKSETEPPARTEPEAQKTEPVSLPTSAILPPSATGHLSVPIAMAPPEPAQAALPPKLLPPPPPEPLLPPPPKPPPPPPPLPPKAEPKPSPIETYTSDFSDRMKKSHASTATVLAAEQDARRGAPTAPVKKQSEGSGALYIIGGVALLVAGAAGAYYAYTQYLAKSAPVIIAPVISAPIFVNQTEEISGEGAVLLKAILASVARPLSQGEVRFLHLPIITGANESIFVSLQLPSPDMLLRNIVTSGSMAGIVHERGVSPFFILSVTSYTDTFAAMLSWEPRMPQDMSELFLPAPSLATSTPTVSASSPTVFYDEIIANHDARIYRDSDENEQIVYGYWDQKTLVIARDSAAFAEIMSRLATTRK